MLSGVLVMVWGLLMSSTADTAMESRRKIAFLPGSPATVTYSRPKVIIFSAPSSTACSYLENNLRKTQHRYARKVEFVVIDVSKPENAPLAVQYTSGIIPTIVFITSAGKVRNVLYGYNLSDFKVNLKQID